MAGIGFTMSLFIGGLAFSQYGAEFTNKVVLGIISGSLISMLFNLIAEDLTIMINYYQIIFENVLVF